MTTQTLPLTLARQWDRVTCAAYSAAPSQQSAAPAPGTDAGVYQLSEALDVNLGAQSGVPATVLLAPFSPDSSGWTLRVYGAKPVTWSATTGAPAGWAWIPLYKGTVTPQGSAVGTGLAAGIATGEYATASATTAIGNDGVDCQPTNPGSGEGIGTVRVDTRGCMFLRLYGDDTSHGALVSRQ